jgi:hypothetical protein
MDQAVSDPLWEHITDSDSQPQGMPGGPPLHRVSQLSTQRKDFFRITVGDVTHFREDEPPARLLKELFSQAFLQTPNLGADGSGS